MIQLHKIALLVALLSLTAAREYANFQQLVNSDGTPANFQLYWTVEGELIQIKITAQTSGWIGFGFSPDGTMVKSDVVIGWVSANGDHFFDDRYAVQYSEPIIDVNMVPPGENNCQLLSISYQNGWTTIEYSRALDTGDQWDVAVTSGEMLVVWAMGYEGDNPDNGRISRHQYRAVNTVTFIESSGPTLPNVLEPTCEGASNRRTYSGDSTGVQSIRLETLAGELRLTGTKTLKNLGVHVLESAYDTTDLQTVQTNFFSPSPDAWVVTSQRGTASLSSPSSTTGPVSGTQGTLNTTISASECVAASMHLTVPSVPPAQISGYTYQGNVVLNELTVGNNFQVKTNAGQISGVVYTQDGTISIQTEWAEVSMQVERHLSFEGTAIMRVIFVGYAGSYDVSVSSDTYKFTVGGDTVTPVSGATTYESGYVGFEGQVASVNITADCDLEVVFIHDAGTLTADLQIPSFNVPKRRTSYICTTVDLPSDQDYHIIRIDPIDKQTSGRSVLHHMVLFVCETQLAYTEPWDCSMMDPQCISMLYVWAIGGSNFYLPEEAGFLIGPNGDKYGILQLHYDNPDGLEDVWDNSGFRIYYTTDLRQYNAGIVEVGVMEIAIPPGETAYQVGELGNGCPAECTTLNIPDESGVVVFASMLHAHLAGRQIWTEHYRPAENGSLVRIEDLNNNPYYDFNVQSYDVFNPPKVLMPGDALVTYCVYNTEDRTEVTTYGLSSYKEMCYNFIAYYPESAWFMCVGYPSSPGATTGIAYCDDQVIVNSWGSVVEEEQ